MHPPTLADEPTLYSISPRAAWIWARRTGQVMQSPKEARDGHVQLLSARDVKSNLVRHFAGRADLVLLAVRVRRLPEGALRWAISTSGERVPCLHGSLSLAHVEQVYELPLDARGVHGVPSVVSNDR